MPELPEVETVRTSLSTKIIGLTIKNVQINNHNLRYKVDLEIINFLPNKSFIKVARIAKYLIFYLSDNTFILSHLGMSGSYTLTNSILDNSRSSKHDHIIITFENNNKLIYNDPRRFGRFNYFTDNNTMMAKLPNGLDPTSSAFNSNYLQTIFKNKSVTIRTCLFDQNIIAGLGNIYISEILWLADIHPKRIAATLSPIEIKKLIKASKSILKRAIKIGGSSLKDFKNLDQKTGLFQFEFNAYNKNNQKCLKKNCFGGIIKKEQLNQRTSYQCEQHQK